MERDVAQILIESHATLGALARRLGRGGTHHARSGGFDDFVLALGAHQAVIDKAVVPALKAFGWRGVSSSVLTGHAGLKRLLAETLTMARDHPSFDAARQQLVQAVRTQCERERVELIPVLRRALDEPQRAMAALEADLHLTRLLGDKPDPWRDSELQPGAGELIEEAQIVLGSLAAAGSRPPAPR